MDVETAKNLRQALDRAVSAADTSGVTQVAVQTSGVHFSCLSLSEAHVDQSNSSQTENLNISSLWGCACDQVPRAAQRVHFHDGSIFPRRTNGIAGVEKEAAIGNYFMFVRLVVADDDVDFVVYMLLAG